MAARRGNGRSATSGSSKPRQNSGGRQDRRDFTAEAEEILERVLEDLGDLQEQREDAREFDPQVINRIFRSAHSLKGLAGMFGMESISRLAHHLEDVLDGLRMGRMGADSRVAMLLDEGVALVVASVKRVGRGDADSDADEAAASAFIEKIASLRSVTSNASESTRRENLDVVDLEPEVLQALTEYEEHRLSEAVRLEREIAILSANFDLACFEDELAELSESIQQVGELISTLPSPDRVPEGQIRFSLLIAMDIDVREFFGRFENFEFDLRSTRGSRTDALEIEAAPTPELDDSIRGDVESVRSIGDTIRVDVEKLDELMNLVGELVIQRNALAEVVGRLSADAVTARLGAELGEIHKRFKRKIEALQSGVVDVRMVPMRQVFERLSRVARRLRRDLGKNVALEFHGAETELDKYMVENLIDPLVHIVRNALDHAIESSEERTVAGKPAIGKIEVRAMQRGNHVVVEVEDDGRGMSLESILSAARARGLVGEEEEISDRDLLSFIFEPGFSTRDQVTSTSGRGVGMDVVRSNLAEMGGVVELDSAESRGTTVTIKLPITLAIMQTLVVSAGSERFVIPLTSVLETLVVEPDQVTRSKEREIINLRGEPLLLKRLAEELEIDSPGRQNERFVVVVGVGDQRLGILVDQLEGQQDAVIKPIKGPVRHIPGIAGAAELGSRDAILVVDVAGIAGSLSRRREAA